MARQHWEVESSGGQCAATGRALREGDEFYSVLFEEGEGFRRVDYAAEAWQGPPEGSFCHFKTRVPVKEKRKRLLVDDDVLGDFFVRLGKETEEVRVQFRFVLALILMRKRRLKYEGTSVVNEVETWTMISVRDGKSHKVVNPRLTDEQIEGVSEQLTAILHSDAGNWAQEPHAEDLAETDGNGGGANSGAPRESDPTREAPEGT